jgi:hypothetical protein
MAITKKPTFVIPKKMGEWPDLLHGMREKRLAAQREVDAMEADEKLFKEHIINTIPKSEASGVAGKEYRIKKSVPQVKDLAAFRAYVLKTKDLDLLTKALNKTHVEELWDSGKKVAGVEAFDAVSVSLTKI